MAGVAFMSSILIISTFFIETYDVASYATFSNSASADTSERLNTNSILTTISMKVYCGVNYFFTSPETWKCKTLTPPNTTVTVATTTQTTQAVALPIVATTSQQVLKEIVKYTPQVVAKNVTVKQINQPDQGKNNITYVTKYIPVPGPKGETGERGAIGPIGPTGSFSYVPVLSVATNNNGGTFSNQNLSSTILTNTILNGLSTFTGSLNSQDISATSLITSGSTTLATTTVTSLTTNSLESLLSSSTEIIATNVSVINSTTTNAFFSNLFGAGLNSCNTVGDKLIWNNGTFSCGVDAGAGGGITNLNGSIIAGQTFTTTSTSGLNLSITTATTTGVHTFAIGLASGYFIPNTASTTDWNNFFNTPTNYLTGGQNIILSGTSTIAVNPNSVFTSIGIGTTTPSLLFSIASSTGASIFGVTNDGILSLSNPVSGSKFSLNDNGSGVLVTKKNGVEIAGLNLEGFRVPVDLSIGWTQNSAATIAMDTAFSRLSANKIGIGNGTPGDFSGTLITSTLGIGTSTSGSAFTLASGQMSLQLGTAEAPTITPIGNASSGIFWTSPTNLSVSVDGAERFRVGSGGAIASTGGYAIGLSVSGADAWLNRISKGVFAIGSRGLGYDSTSDKNGTLIAGQISLGTTTPFAQFSIQGTYGSTTPLFSVASTTSSSFATSSLFTILANGNVGVGTSTPLSTLSVVGGTSDPFNVYTTSSSSVFHVANNGLVSIGTSADVTNKGEMLRFNIGSSGGSTGYLSFNRAHNTNASYQFGFNDGDGFGLKQVGDSAPFLKVSSTGTLNSNKLVSFGSSNGVVDSSVTIYNGFTGGTPTHLSLSNLETPAFSNTKIAFQSWYSPDTLAYETASIVGIKYTSSNFLPQYGLAFNIANNSTSTTEAMRISSNGNVGIGTTEPDSILSIASSTANGTSNLFSIASSSSIFNVLANGNVGIGIINPTTQLDLSGSMKIAGQATINGASGGIFGLTFNNGLSNYNINAPGYSIIGGVSFDASGLGNDIGNVRKISFTNGYIDASSGSNPSTVAGSYRFSILNNSGWTPALQVQGIASQNANLFQIDPYESSNGKYFNVSSSGNVGIGSTSPSSLLSVIASSTNYLSPFISFNSTTSPIFNILANGNIGIGTLLPQTPLHIYGDGSNGITLETVGGSMKLSNQGGGLFKIQSGVNGGLSLGSSGDTELYRYAPSTLKTTGDFIVDDRMSIGTNTLSSMISITGTSTRDLMSVTSSSSLPVFNILADGNIGIGTNNPEQKLSVIGNVAFTGGLGIGTSSPLSALNIYANQDDGIRLDDKTNNRTSYITNTAYGLGINSAGNGLQLLTGGQIRLTINDSGNIGIGTTTPENALEVIGNIGLTGSNGITFADGTNNPLSLYKLTTNTMTFNSRVYSNFVGTLVAPTFAYNSGSAGNGIYFPNNGSDLGVITNSTERLRIDMNGNVGIGTSTPISSLHLVAQNNSTPLMVASSSGKSMFSVGRDGTVLVGTDYANYPEVFHYGNGFLLAQGDIGFIGNGTHHLTNASTGNIGIQLFNGSQNIVPLTASYSGQNGLIGINNNHPNFSLDIKGTSTTSPFNVASSTGDSLFTILANGKIGVGTNNPLAFIHIEKNKNAINNMYITNSATGTSAYSQIVLGENPANAQSLTFTYANTGNGAWSSNTGVIEAGVNTTGGLVLSTTGNSPVKIYTNNTERVRVTSAGNIGIGTIAPTSLLTIASSTANGTSTLFSVATSSSVFNVLANGNIGIGITNPGSKLDIFGSLFVTGGGDIYAGGGNIQIAGGYTFRNLNDDLRLATQASKDIIFSTSASSEKMRIKDSGNVGIGTTTPNSILSIASSTANDTTNLFSIATSSSIFNVLANGNVGIGTSSPQTKLHVWGNNDGHNLARFGASSIYLDIHDNAGYGNPGIKTSTGVLDLSYVTIGGMGGTASPSLKVKSQIAGTLIQSWLDFSNNTLGVFTSSGNFGIGTTTPLSLLSLASSTANGTSTLFSVATSSSIFTILANGNIGAGLHNPTNLFDVNGVLGIKQPGGTSGVNELTISHNGHQAEFINSDLASSTTKENFVFTGPRTGGGTVRMGFDSAGQIFSDYSSIRFNTSAGQVAAVVNGGWETRDSYQFLWSSDPNPAGPADAGLGRFATSTVKVTNGSVGWGNLIAGNIGIGTTTSLATLTVVGTSTKDSIFTVASSTGESLFSILSNENIGVGTSTPLARVGIAGKKYGETLLDLSTTFGGTIGLNISPTGIGVLTRGINVNASSVGIYSTASDTNGTGIYGGGYGLSAIGVKGSTGGGGVGVFAKADSIGGYAIKADGTTGADIMLLQSEGIDKFIIMNNGNVGIGTSTPQYLLDVNGDTRIKGELKISSTLNNFTGGIGVDGTGTLLLNSTNVAGVNVYGKLAPSINNWELGDATRRWDGYFTNINSSATSTFFGNVGIGTISPSSKLTIYSTTTSSDIDILQILSDVGGAGNPIFRIDSDGDIFTDGGTTIGNPADVAENYSSIEIISPGTIVTLATTTVEWNLAENNYSSTTYNISQVRIAHPEDKAFGIVSTRPGILLGGNTASGTPIALSGRVPVRVTNENGKVKRGDYITLSKTMPGYAMKMLEHGRSIGRSLSDMETTSEATGTIIVFIDNSYNFISVTKTEDLEPFIHPSATLTQIETIITEALSNGTEVLSSLLVTKVSAIVAYIDTLFVKNIHAEKIDATMFCIGEEGNKTCLTKEKIDQLLLLQSVQNVSASTNNVTDTNVSSTTENVNNTSNIPTEIPEAATYTIQNETSSSTEITSTTTIQ
ncbi:MAG: hypothetical protein KBC41_03460 [Candidatus Pacebacteria bacterium]|nr:hypothetical protein [Candidatus Paceibacterota bacterium]